MQHTAPTELVTVNFLFGLPGGWGNSCYLINFATISLVVLLTIPYFLQKNNIRFNIYPLVVQPLYIGADHPSYISKKVHKISVFMYFRPKMDSTGPFCPIECLSCPPPPPPPPVIFYHILIIGSVDNVII